MNVSFINLLIIICILQIQTLGKNHNGKLGIQQRNSSLLCIIIYNIHIELKKIMQKVIEYKFVSASAISSELAIGTSVLCVEALLKEYSKYRNPFT